MSPPFFRRARSPVRRHDKRSTLKSVLVVLAFAALFFGFAGLITLAAPITSIELVRRGDGKVDADVWEYALWAVPFSQTTVRDVQKASDWADHPQPSAIDGRTGSSNSATEGPRQVEVVGNLILTGADGEVSTYCSPENLSDVVRDVNEFLKARSTQVGQSNDQGQSIDQGQTSLKLWQVANWKFSVIIPAVVAVPGLLLIVGLYVDVFRSMFRRRQP